MIDALQILPERITLAVKGPILTRAIKLRRDGHTLKQIALALNVSLGAVWRALARCPLPLPHRSRKWTRDQALPLYRRYQAGTSLASIARELGCSRQNLDNIFRSYGLRIRRKTLITSRKLAQAVRLRRDGHTLQEIGKELRVNYSTVRLALIRDGEHQPRRHWRPDAPTG
jgi:DNA-binding CsgD family transcriptional regulator